MPPPEKITPMDHLINQCSGIANPSRLNRTFNIIVVYETFVSAARALRACELLRQEIPPDVSMRINAWRIASLEDDAESQLAASSASLADVILLSTSGRISPPPVLHHWLDLWLSQRISSPTALFAIFGEHLTPAAVATATILQRKSSSNGIDFFMHPTHQPDQSAAPIQLGWKNNDFRLQKSSSDTTTLSRDHESAFDTIENFAAHLHSLILELAATDLPEETCQRIKPIF